MSLTWVGGVGAGGSKPPGNHIQVALGFLRNAGTNPPQEAIGPRLRLKVKLLFREGLYGPLSEILW